MWLFFLAACSYWKHWYMYGSILVTLKVTFSSLPTCGDFLCLLITFEYSFVVHGFKKKKSSSWNIISVRQFGSGSGPMFCWTWSGYNLFIHCITNHQSLYRPMTVNYLHARQFFMLLSSAAFFQNKFVLLKDTTQWRRWGSNPPPLGLESSTLPLSHCAP